MSELAINGGPKAVESLPGRFQFGPEEKAAIDAMFDEAMASGHIPGYGGPCEDTFCKAFAEELGGGFADGTNSGTTSVFVALKALELPPMSEVIVGCITDCGGVMPVVYNNCIPIPADAAPGTFAPGPAEIEARITERTSAIVVAHIFGDPTDMFGIMKVAEKYHLPVVEDCAQSHYTFVKGQRAGTFGATSAFSLMFGKHFCAGGQGGAVFTKDEDLYWKVRRSSDRGKPFNAPGKSNLFPSLNFNMDEFHATIATIQLKKLHGIVERRRKLMQGLYDMGGKELACLSFPQLSYKDGDASSFWKGRLAFHQDRAKCSFEEYMKALQAEGVTAYTYRGGFPFAFDWYKNRANTFPWTCSDYKGDPKAEYPCPNVERTLTSQMTLEISESYGERECAMLLEGMQKVDRAFAK